MNHRSDRRQHWKHLQLVWLLAGVVFSCLQMGCNLGKRIEPTTANWTTSSQARLESTTIPASPVGREQDPLAPANNASKPSNRNLVQVGFQQDDLLNGLDSTAEIEAKIPSQIPPLDGSQLVDDPGAMLSLQQVLISVANCYPEIEIAIGEIESAQGKALASWGEFDVVFAAQSISQPLGFYQTYRNGAGLSQPLYGGGEVYGNYRIGDGNFEPWYGERETNEGGELKAGFSLPLLKDRGIDKRRADIRRTELDQLQVEANVETRLLQFERFATQAYWDWVASGQAVQIQQQLLELAEQRVEQINIRIEKGDLAQIAKIDNDRFIAKRKNGLIKARRGLEKAAIKLSLFHRDKNCTPIVADIDSLPNQFPNSMEISQSQTAMDVESALRNRPELIELAAAREQAGIQLQYAENFRLPKLDVKGFAGQDLGGATSSKGDKTPFELQLGVFAEVPIQRREGAGKVQAARGKIRQIDAKRRYVSDKIRAKIQDAASAVNAAAEQIQQSEVNVRLNEQSLELGRLSFEEGDIDLLALNIYESSIADARLQLLDAQFKYFFSLAAYRAITRSEAFANSIPLSRE